jgi:hypothetical protein
MLKATVETLMKRRKKRHLPSNSTQPSLLL